MTAPDALMQETAMVWAMCGTCLLMEGFHILITKLYEIQMYFYVYCHSACKVLTIRTDIYKELTRLPSLLFITVCPPVTPYGIIEYGH